MIKIACQAGKGGVGKTTTVVHVACALGARGYRVLVLDLDGQAQTSKWLTRSQKSPKMADLSGVITRQVAVRDAIIETDRPGVSVIFGSRGLAMVIAGVLDAASEEIADRDARWKVVARILDDAADDFDICLMDCPPSVNPINGNALYAADALLVPVLFNRLSADGLLGATKDAVQMVQNHIRESFPTLLVLPTMTKTRKTAGNLRILNEIAGRDGAVYQFLKNGVRRREQVGDLYDDLSEKFNDPAMNFPTAFEAERHFAFKSVAPFARDYEAVTEELITRLGLAPGAREAVA